LAAGVVLGLAFLTRTSGIALVVAVGAFFCFRRKFRVAALPIGMASIFIFGWMGWCYLNRTHDQGVNAGYYESYFQTLAVVIKEAQASGHASIVAIVSRMVAKNFLMLVPVSVPIVCTGLSYDWPSNFGTEGQVVGFILFSIVLILTAAGFFRLRTQGRALKLIHLYVLTYLGLQMLWPYSGYDRFLMPLLPFLSLFLILGFAHPVNLVRVELSRAPLANRISAAFVALVLITLVGASFSAYSYGLYGSVFKVRKVWVTRAQEDREAIQWVSEHTTISDVLICYRDPTYYLHTERKATRCSPLRTGGITAAQPDDLDEQANTIFKIIEENKARYLILTSTDMELEDRADLYRRAYNELLEKHSEIFVPVFTSPSGATIYRIDGQTAR